MKNVILTKTSAPNLPVNVKYCDTFFSKFKGLMFSKQLKPDSGIIIVEQNESRINTAIHMMFMNYDITVLWLNKDMVIIDKVLAKKWNPYYAPSKPAQFVLELHPSRFPDYAIGEKLVLDHPHQ